MYAQQWHPGSWSTNYQRKHMPVYHDMNKLSLVKKRLMNVPPLVFAHETIQLKNRIAMAQQGNAYIIQGGDCAESMHMDSVDSVMNLVNLLAEMSAYVSYELELPVCTVGRIAGQYAKPRSNETETRDGITLPSFMGSIVNEPEFDLNSRIPNAENMMIAYRHSSSIQNMVRSMITSGYLSQEHMINIMMDNNTMRKALRFASNTKEVLMDNILYTSHEALLLDYEEPLTRVDSITNKWFNTSSHLLWLGMRTCFENSSHVEYLRGIENPIGIKVGPSMSPEQIGNIIEILNPLNEYGKIVLIFRLGVHNVERLLPKYIEHNRRRNVLWMCDPMHGNTSTCDVSKLKKRVCEDIVNELKMFQLMCKAHGVHFGGMHVEISGDPTVTECVTYHDMVVNQTTYKSLCDPRLNRQQSINLIKHTMCNDMFD